MCLLVLRSSMSITCACASWKWEYPGHYVRLTSPSHLWLRGTYCSASKARGEQQKFNVLVGRDIEPQGFVMIELNEQKKNSIVHSYVQ